MREIRTRLGIRALALVCVVIGICVAMACVFVALKSVKSDHAREPLTTDGLFQIEKDVVAARQRIKSGHVILSLKDIGRTTSKKEYEIFFDGDKSRADLRVAGRLQSQVICTGHEIVRVIGQREPEVFALGSHTTSFMEIPDPRRLGLVNWCFESINQFGYAAYIGRTDRTGVQVEPAIRNGDSVWMVTFKSKNGKATIEYWLSRDKGNLPIFISVKSVNDPPQVQSLDVELSKWADGEIWFPKQVRFRDVHGERLDSEETVTIETAEFGRAIDDATFKLSDR